MKSLLLGSVAFVLAAPAFAADLPTKKAPMPLPVITEYNWTGFYFGGNLGWDWGWSNFNTYNTVNGAFTDGGNDHLSSFIGGGQIGYRYIFPQRFVIGAEASLDCSGGSSNNHSNATGTSDWTTYSSGLGGKVVGTAGYA